MKPMAPIMFVTVVVLALSASTQAQTGSADSGAPTAVPEISVTPAHIPLGSRVGEAPSAYDDGGRRDPFVSLVVSRRTPAQAKQGVTPTGLAAMSVTDVVVSGITSGGNVRVAVLEGPNRQSFSIQLKAHLLDAVVTRIDADAVVFTLQGESGTPAQQVRKTLRSTGGEVR